MLRHYIGDELGVFVETLFCAIEQKMTEFGVLCQKLKTPNDDEFCKITLTKIFWSLQQERWFTVGAPPC